MAQPGGNVTGFVNLEPSVTGQMARVAQGDRAARKPRAIFYNPTTAPYDEIYLRPLQGGGRSLGMELIAAPFAMLTELRNRMRLRSVAQSRTVG